MALIKLQFRPGINRDNTDYANEGGWYECDKIRFRSGYPEKLGGWTRVPLALPFIGWCRQMWNWVTSYQDNLLALGTNVKVYIETDNTLYDITPLRANEPIIGPGAVTTGAVSTTVGARAVLITLTGQPHEATTGDYVVISGIPSGTFIGGIPAEEINGNHVIGAVPDIFSFTIQTLTAATSTVTGAGGAGIVLEFEIQSGNASAIAGYGWGTGVWGHDAWGSDSTSPIYLQQKDWWFDNFDNDLVMNLRNGPGYWWERGNIRDPSVALSTKAISLYDYAVAEGFSGDAVPAQIMQLMVSQQDKHLIAFGANPFGFNNPDDFDPLLIRWADQDTPGDWTPGVLNSAGDIRISRGSRIIRALPTRQEILIWTDERLWGLQFLGTTDVFGLQEYAENISIISPRSVITASNVTYWMGKDKFYAYTGRVESLPCSLRDHVFNDINHKQNDQIVCGTNEEWNEVWWFYPTSGANYNNAYVVYQHIEQIWYYGYLSRTAWLDTPMHPHPMACSTDPASGLASLYHHEDGLNDVDQPIHSFIQSSDFDLDEGDKFMLIKRLIPDVSFLHDLGSGEPSVDPHSHDEPSVTIQLRPRNFPGGRMFVSPPDSQKVIQTTVGRYTDQVFLRARARQMAFKISSDQLNMKWSLGNPRLDARPDGTR